MAAEDINVLPHEGSMIRLSHPSGGLRTFLLIAEFVAQAR